ncbi:MAG: hypothetical protein MK212_04280 [Saprospiraceae bacterium]|nr:hypothetical protein [Saprospiraceae bacterium]
MYKTKIKPEELSSMTYKDYATLLKKEVKKAQRFQHVDVIVLSDFKFSCETVASLMILGKFGGPIAKWYKTIKKERKVEKDFAKGSCYFEPQSDGSTTLHIALNDGKGKPTKMVKNGKKLFKRLGFVPNIFKGELPTELLENSTATLTDTEIERTEEEAEESNEGKGIGMVAKQYQQAFKRLANQVVPMLKMKDQAVWVDKHLDIAKKAYLMSKSFVDKFEESSDKAQEKFAQFKAKVLEKQPMLQKIFAKVKKLLTDKAQVHGSDKNMEAVLKDVDKTIEELNAKAQEAFKLIEEIRKEKNL